MKIGFTGTQEGMTTHQEDALLDVLDWLYSYAEDMWFVHGQCIGADTEGHHAAFGRGYNTESFPSDIKYKTGKCPKIDKRHNPLPPLQRNRLIVNEADVMVACPKGYKEELRSGTWATIRFARKQGKVVLVIWPNGEVETR